mgnify:CR=1 FL=1
MARENVDLYQEQFTENQTRPVLERLRADFDAHNHDGSNSKYLENIIARTLQVNSAIIGGYRLFEATVGPTQSNYKSVAEALLAGETRIFVRNGTYTAEPIWSISTASTTIIGESMNGVDITFADDTTANNRNIYINATRVTVGNMKLTAFATNSNDLFEFGASGSRPYLFSLILKNTNGAFFESSAITNFYATIRDVYLDMTTSLSAANMIGFNTVKNSLVENCFVDMTGLTSTYTGVKVITGCVNVRFVGFTLYADQASNIPSLDNSPTCAFVGSYFYLQEMTFAAHIDSSFIENNVNAPAGYLVALNQVGSRFTNNRVKTGAASDQLLQSSAANTIITSNYFDGGSKILLQHASVTIRGGIFSNNTWIASYDGMDLNLGTNTLKWNAIGNTIRNNKGGGITIPTITDGGTTNNAAAAGAMNQLILG